MWDPAKTVVDPEFDLNSLSAWTTISPVVLKVVNLPLKSISSPDLPGEVSSKVNVKKLNPALKNTFLVS